MSNYDKICMTYSMMKHTLFSLAVLSTLFAASCSGLFFSTDRDDFITVRGTQFFHGDKPYYYAGTNLWYGCYLGSPGETGDRERLLRELDALKANGFVNLRVLAASEESNIRRSVKPAIQRSPGVLDDSLLQGLDYLLAEMAERKMHAVVFLNNYWEWSGGMAQYNAWANGEEVVDPEDRSKGWGAFMNYSATFYDNNEANRLYRDFVRRIVTRRNTCNGRNYSEDPTIMAWQLANEPRPGTDSPEGQRNLPSFYRWIDQTAEYIHSLDTNHLVSAGSEGMVGCLWSAEYFLAAHQTRQIDYLTFHLWPVNWGWYNPKKIDETYPRTEANALDYINKHMGLARRLNRPIVMEEFGLVKDSGSVRAGGFSTARDRYYEKVFSVLYDSARAGAPYAGSNFWGWGGEGRGKNPDHMWRKGDPFVGDPPQDPQGLNSIFDADTSTIRIIREHAFRMLRLGVVDTLYAHLMPGPQGN